MENTSRFKSTPSRQRAASSAASSLGRLMMRSRRRRELLRPRIGGGIEAGDQANAGGFHIALAARHLAGKAQPRRGAQPQLLIEKFWRVEKGVAMQPAEPRELGVLQPWNGAEHALLRTMLQLGLEADDV